MASVQELLLAAEAKKRPTPLLDLLNAGIQGYQTGQGIAKTRGNINETNVDIALKLIQKQQIEQEIEQRRITQDLLRKTLGLRDNADKDKFQSSGVPPAPVMADDKLKSKINVDSKGDISASFETIEPKALTIDSYEKALAQQYNEGKITLQEFEEKSKKSKELPPSLIYTMEKDKQKEVLDQKAKVIPGYEQTGEVAPDDVEVRNLRKGVSEFETFKTGVSDYKNLINKYGTSEPTDRAIQGKLEAYAKNLQLKIKNLAQLGVLSASDVPFIEKQIPGPGAFKTVNGMIGALDTANKLMEEAINNSLKLSGYRKKGQEKISSDNSDLYSMSDEELRAIAEGK